MKTTRFKKIISITVAMCLLLTVCLAAPLTASAATVSVTVNNSGTVYTVDATVGEELPAPTERANGMTFLGWYSDPACTTEYGAVQANETRTAYAKYPSTYIPFNEKEYVVNDTIRDNSQNYSGAYASGVVTDPDDADNKVFKLHSNALYATVLLPMYDDADAAKYQLVEGHNYTISFKYKIPDSLTVSSFGLRITQGASCGSSNHYRKALDAETARTITVSDLTVGQWKTYTASFTPTGTSTSTSPMISLNCAGTASETFGADNYAYFDDVVITDNTAVADLDIPVDNTYTSFEGCTVSYEGGFNSTTSASILTEAAHSGTSSLKIAPSGTNTYRSYIYNAPKSALKLESYTKYTISYWYMATALAGDYTNIYLTLNGNGSVWDKNIQLAKTSIHGSALDEWHKVEVTVITGDCSSQAYLTAGLQTAAAGTVVYIDDVSVTAVETIGLHDYYCDFSADFSHYGDPDVTDPWPYYSSKVNFNTDDGILYFPTTHPTAPSTGSTYVQHFAPYDGNSYYQFESNSAYRVVIRYKQTLETETNTGYFSIGAKTAIPKSEPIKSLAINNQVGSTEWQEYTFDFTTGDLGDFKYLTLTFGSKDGTSAEFEVDYIKVTKGPFINNNGAVSKNTTAVGSEISKPSYDANTLEFVGWFSDPECTKPFGVVLENETRTAYARYNKTVITISDGGLFDSREDAASVITDPEDMTNKAVYQEFAGYWATIEPTMYDANGATYYKLIPNVDYTVTFDYKLTSAVTEELSIRVNSGTIPDYSSSYPKTVYTNTEVKVTADQYGTGWSTYTATFNSGSLANGDHLFLCLLIEASDYTGKGLYLDNVTIYNSANFTTVTTNDRGVVSEVEMVVGQELPALRSLDEQSFLGWYSDPECTVPFGAVQADETRTAYAKYDTTKVSFNVDSAVDGLTQIGQNWVVKLDSDATLSMPAYDAAGASDITLEANTTYALRFIYKVLDGSAAGKLAVLGNELEFDAYDAANANVWNPGAITFTTTEATELQLALTSDSNASVYIDDLLLYKLDQTPETTVTAGSSTISATAPVAQNNMQTGTVSIDLADGEQLKVNGLTVTYDIYATAFSEPVQSKIILSTGAYDLDGDDVPGDGSEFVYMVPANARNIKISAEFISDTETNIGVIAGSVREKSDTYSSGLRFRGRVYNDADIKKVGFLLAPEKLITKAGHTALTLDNAAACGAVTADATGIVYDSTDLYTDYQVILTGIDNLLATDIQCVLYVEHSDGTVKYAEARTLSYNDIVAAMNAVHRGITSYYSEEYEDTRDKLLQTQADGSFSFILLSDTHIDYTHTVKEGEYWYTADVGGKSPDRPLVERELAMVIEMANTTDVDCIILGGDLIHGTASYANSMADLEYYAAMAQKSKVPVYVNRGNHDANDYHGDICALTHIIDQEDWTTTLLDPASKNTAVHDANDPNSTYYYVDFENKKTRLIVLDPYNYPVISNDGVLYSTWKAETWGGFNSDIAQLKWFAEVALDAEKQGWNYVLSSHSPIYGPETFAGNGNIQAIVAAFNNKTTATVNGLTVDYTDTDGQIPFSVSGHTHKSSYRLFNDGDHVCVNVGSGKISYYPNNTYNDSETHKWYHPVRYEDTYSEALFDAIVYAPDSDTVTRYNFGVNPDNIFEVTDSGITVTEQPHERTDIE